MASKGELGILPMATDHARTLPFDLYQRYSVVAKLASEIGKSKGRKLKVLDVGGCAFALDGIRRFLPISEFLADAFVVVLDTQDCQFPNYVVGTGATAPFADGSFDLVVASDVLEHVEPDERGGFVEELSRVSDDFLVISSPFRQDATLLAEQILWDYITSALSVQHVQLREHLDLGLPDKEQMASLFTDKGYAFVEFPSGNVYRWLDMMMARHYVIGLPNGREIVSKLDEFYNVSYSQLDVASPGYRHVFVCSKRGTVNVLENIRKDALAKTRNVKGSGEAEPTVPNLMMALLVLRHSIAAENEHRQQIVEKERHVAHLETLVSQQEKTIADLRQALKDYADNLIATRAKLELTESDLKRIKSGRLLATVMRLQEIFRGRLDARQTN
ncbi:MAG: class I SAM-dependent methyltransferase [Chloroflexi bacterium]|nr:class I SAM-dependent methyltransferase [Chloroflexota bacterium]